METWLITTYTGLINSYLKAATKLMRHDVSMVHLQIRIPGSRHSSDIVMTRLTTLLKKRSTVK